MITTMRRYRRVLQIGLLVVIAAFVLTSVFVFGQGNLRNDPGDAVAIVNGESISLARYQRAYQNYANMISQASRRPLTPELAEQLGVARQVVDMLVTETVVLQRARAEGLEATDREINESVYAIPAFQDNGRFSVARYRDVLRRNGLTEVGFEEDVRRELTRVKVESLVRNGVKVPDDEVDQAYRLKNEEVRAAWALIELAPLIAKATATDEDREAYLKAHPGEFSRPEQRRIQYVVIAPNAFIKPVSEAAIEKYYTEHATEFDVPPEAHAYHVLVRVPATGGSEAEDRARAKAADAIRRVKAGEDFAKVARELSEDPESAARGGDLGVIHKGEMVPAFEQSAFALRSGEVSPEPVRTPFGFHAIKVTDVRSGGRRPLKEVAGTIRERLAGEAADAAARAKADELKPPLQAAADFEAEARKLGTTPIPATVARLERRQPVAGPDPLEEAAFALSVGGVSAPVRTPAGWVILKSVEAIPAGVPPMAEIKEPVTAAVKRQKAEASALELAKQVAADAAGGDLAGAARKAGATTGETPRFSRGKPPEKLSGDALLAALQTPAGGLTAPVKTPQGYYILKVLERVAPDPGKLATVRDQLGREVLAQKQGQAWEAWLASARASAKVQLTGRAQPPQTRG
jgi:peptidyl-prolyl cis-trans isomerase D